ncbi:hypothetical protein ACFWNN_23200 [Lentzea sp. NPDC058450]|uniref:hypothetical protein n=1 Tax=Lentzea sp. NPDC058450 TaxID=3346505 RepID=UPI00366532F4
MQESGPHIVIGATTPTRSLVETTTPHPWVTATRDYLGPNNTQLKACVAVIAHLASDWERNRTEDPWLDGEFAERFNVRLEWLRELVFTSATSEASDVETALLVTFPYLHQTFWAKLATATLQGADPAVEAFASTGELRKFSAFAAEHELLHRRGARLFEAGDPAAHAIAW